MDLLLTDYMDADVAYLMGLIMARGTLHEAHGIRQITEELLPAVGVPRDGTNAIDCHAACLHCLTQPAPDACAAKHCPKQCYGGLFAVDCVPLLNTRRRC
jgi:hypothetical protein